MEVAERVELAAGSAAAELLPTSPGTDGEGAVDLTEGVVVEEEEEGRPSTAKGRRSWPSKEEEAVVELSTKEVEQRRRENRRSE